VLTEIYPAGEAPIAERRRPRAGARGARARQGRSGAGGASARLEERRCRALLRDGDLLLLLGAGDIGAAANELAAVGPPEIQGRLMSAASIPDSRFPLPGRRVEDAKAFGRVAVVMGGQSAEREVSLDSGRNVLAALQGATGVDAHAVDGIPALLDALRAGHYARVFNILHGGGGENGELQGALQALRVPFTGSGVLGSALTLDKIRAKQVWQALGLPTPRFKALPRGADVQAAAREIGLPLIVKPRLGGFQRRRHARVRRRRASTPRSRWRGAIDGRPADGDADRGRRVHGRHPRRRGTADDPHRAEGRVLRLQRQVRRRGHRSTSARAWTARLSRKCATSPWRAFDALACSGWGRVDVMRDRDGRNSTCWR
jgi:D-alanine-D-alanine ligase